MENFTGNANKTTTKTSPNDKKERRWNKRDEETGNMGKNNSTTEGNKPESAGERRKIKGRLKRYQQRIKQNRQNRTFQNNERKFYQQAGTAKSTILQLLSRGLPLRK